ncbi:Adventurous gliding motility protein K [Labilithrix luteola]|uniref:Adventurous gliding motility protein K n=1 Tax=Labilithrix luteola TaxID=1391654 RepID=A0A0K1QB21_9BACT|nr:tetratricopeptide repeat protein [Labilithrix luteola]AKV02986.1 Adventurous gliding motility protein K [Labilithrix luteola]
MDRAEIDRLVQRLVENPHDEEALGYAHQAGETDPKAYAMLLERVGTDTRDPAYAAHWLAEAANVWSTTLGDAHRAARVLMMAIDKDPTAQVAAERLAQLYRDKGDSKALVALLDRRAKAIAPLAMQNDEIRGELAGMHEELGRLWAEPPLSQPKKAIENYKRAVELDPTSAYAIYNTRELYKQLQEWQNALPLYGAELELEQDPGRRVGLLRDEASTRKLAGDLPGASRALAAAREIDASDPALQQEYASSVLDRIQAGEAVAPADRTYAAELLVALAETYEGEHGLAYAGAALDIEPGNDRAVQLYAHYARTLGQEADLSTRYNAYLAANPNGAMAAEVRSALGPAANPRLELSAVSNAPAPSAPSELDKLVEHTSIDEGSQPSQGSSPSVSKRASVMPSQKAASTPPPALDEIEGLNRRGALSPEKLQGILDAAQMLAGKGKKPEAFAKYKEVLDSDPAHPEALGWTEDYLRSKRDYGQLRDVLLASIRATANVPEHLESRKERLREVAGLCEGNLRDIDSAIAAWRQLLAIDRSDESARAALMRLLEKSQRWEELANLLEQEATIESDVDTKVQLERKLAKLQEDKRKDLVAAGEAWGRIARLLGDDDQAILTASRLFEKGERSDQAAAIIAESASGIEDPVARGHLMQRLGELREQLGQGLLAGESYAEAAEALRNGKLWEEADRLYSAAEAWEKAAHAAHQRGLLTGDLKHQATFFARAADYLVKAGRGDDALERLEESTNLDPLNDDYANQLVARYDSTDQVDKLVQFLTKRGDRLTDRSKRVNIRREAASLAVNRLGDKELARELWLKLLEDGDDREALERLIDDAVEREDHTEAATLLRRLGQNTVDKAEKARVALREAELLADGVGDVDTAISRYELILADLDSTCRPALQAIADLQEARGNLAEASDALERELKLVADVQERGQIAARLARLYEKLDDPRNAIRALDLVRKADLEDFDALTRLCELCELTEQWGRVAELLVERIEIEADEQEVVDLTRKLASILADKLDRGDEALGALTDLADAGDATVRQAYIELGDRLGWKGIVASKLKEWWFDARHGTERTAALRGAFERFAEVGRDADAVGVAIELVRTKGADKKLADHLEELAVKTGDHDALTVAHDLLAREVQGAERANELVRQAEVRVRAGMPRNDAIGHGEQGLPFIPSGEAEPLLERLSALATKPVEVIDLYERQVTRSKAPTDRVRALARAAQVASLRGQPERARGFFELGLSGAPTEEILTVLETSAREGDKFGGGDRLRRALCQALAAGGHGARDGGRTRASLLRRAATLAHRDLNDMDQAFSWLADALVAHVDPLTLDMLEALGIDGGDPRRAEGALTHALGEVFDGPLVKQLLARRAKIRRDQLVEPVNAAADLKKLHDLSPSDQSVMDELAGLLMELSDYKGLVQLYEDQILRGKDMNARAELARKVARIWEEQLTDPREAADAWRRVLRMRAGDAEATSGLERAKSGVAALKKPEGDPKFVYAPPKLVSDQPVPPPSRAPGKGASIPPAASAERTSNGPAKPMPSRVPSPPPADDSTNTKTTSSVPGANDKTDIGPRPVAPPVRSLPPPLPSPGSSLGRSVSPPKLPNDVATTLRALSEPPPPAKVDVELNGEIDASFDRLELDAKPSGATVVETASTSTHGEASVSTSAPGSGSSSDSVVSHLDTLAKSGETLADDSTKSSESKAPLAPKVAPVEEAPSSVRAPNPTVDTSLETTASTSGSVVSPLLESMTSATVEKLDGDATTDDPLAEELVSSELLAVDDATGAHNPLEATMSRPQDEEEIVIADDLAEIVDDTRDSVPPFRG